MKIARYVLIGMLGLFVVTIRTSADPLVSDPNESPYTQVDPDGVPLVVRQPQPRRPSQAELDVIHKQQEQAARDKDWLLRGYEKQLQAHAAKSSEDQSTNLYYQLSSNKELAKLAGLPALDSDSQDNTNPYRTGAAPSGQGSVALRADASSAARSGFPSHGNLFKPLITPLSAPEVAGLHHFYSSLPVSMPSPISGGLSQTHPAPSTAQSQDSSDIETPGMIAAEKNPLTDRSTSDLTLDILPGESIEQAKAHQDNNIKLELPLPMDASQLHKAQAAALSVPGAPNAAQTAAPAPAPVNAVPLEDPNAPLPVSKTPRINPVRSPIVNPYDILDR
jgi:hypothetical protein